ncbi:TIGR03087 family PEP-CTERM/XrtA system glycosyltransferase [Noviherbaspirillum autotrophicum]|uniref:TIGR03087 family PEP-CTERM/XrtA system glycosyltransferase n=1 Tax=Noviherbaspirillum autotrophicum TaxID=709839 RepID=UPI000A030BA3|nr:TIGR03087 family PEP-CTERM/XrtA system glycosyltransferase [Noviherbaspirillum autotrophicum]
MEHLLLLVHRIPFPPNKGDKIRSYHLLRHLAKRYCVHLGTFVDDPDDWRYVDEVKRFCNETYFGKLHPFVARVRSISALAAQRPMSLDYYDDPGMHAWVRNLLQRQPIHRVVVFSSAMAQYAEGIEGAQRIIDFVDVDSDKWTQYARGKRWPFSWLYRREGRELLRYERRTARTFDASLFVSPAEAELFRQRAPECNDRIGYYSNGVDTEYFSPERAYDNPYSTDELPIVFTGAMDYWPNVDAVQWFAEKVLPAVRERYPSANFYIVGSRPTENVTALARRPGVSVTGTVPDIRPYLAHACASVAPLRIARGIQNKVLEAMAMAMPVIVSAPALEGIDARPGCEVLLAESDRQFIEALCALLCAHRPEIGCAARRKVVEHYGWSRNLARIDELLNVKRVRHPGRWQEKESPLRQDIGERV